MTRRVLTLGYSARMPEDIRVLVEQHRGILVDVRYSAASRHPRWSKAGFERLLGARYVHCPALGNVRYRQGPPIEIADLDAGVRFLEALSAPVAFVMCACKDAATCHRSSVAVDLRRLGFDVEELGTEHRRAVQGRLL